MRIGLYSFLFGAALLSGACKLPEIKNAETELPPASNTPTNACSEDNSICISVRLEAINSQVEIPSYILNPNFKELIDQINSNQAHSPLNPQDIDVLLRIQNTGTEDAIFMENADNTSLNFQASGPSAVSVRNSFPVTADFREGTPVTLHPGGETLVRFSFLGSGFRRVGSYLFFLKEGNYLLRLDGELSFQGANPAERTQVQITTNTIGLSARAASN